MLQLAKQMKTITLKMTGITQKNTHDIINCLIKIRLSILLKSKPFFGSFVFRISPMYAQSMEKN